MTTQIVIHLLPHEIDWFEWQMKQFKLGSYYLDGNDTFIIDVTLNLNLVEWDKSQIPKQYFINKFNQIQQICDWAELLFTVDEEEEKCMGVNDKRRQSIRSSQADNILYLDSDIIFRPELLKYITDAAKAIEQDYYIISPQLPKLWDDTWDILVNQNYINQIPSPITYESTDCYKIIVNPVNNIKLTHINGFKFGGGWFNLFSTKLLKFIDIPDSLGSYGVDDLFVMRCCDIMKYKGVNIKQFVIEGMVVCENIKYRCNPYKEFIHSVNRLEEYRKQACDSFSKEIKKFISRFD